MDGEGASASAGSAYADLESGVRKPLRSGGSDAQRDYDSQGDAGVDHGGYVPTATRVEEDSPFAHDDSIAGALKDYNRAVRHGFVRKVFGILLAQLSVTFGWMVLVAFNDSTRLYVSQNMWLFWTGLVVSFMSLLAMVCIQGAARNYPTNYMLLGVFTVAETLMLGQVAALEDGTIVLMAIGTTLALVLALVAFASQTTYDITGWHVYLYMGLSTMLLYSIIAGFVGINTGVVYSMFGCLLFSFYVVFDVQLIMGGEGRHLSIGIDDHVLAAMNLYLDILNLFLHILRLLSDRN